MGARGHGQEGGGALAPWKCCEVFCSLVFTVKPSVNQLFMHYFYNFSSASGGKAPRLPSGFQTGPRWRTFSPDSLICPPLEKILRASTTQHRRRSLRER